MVNIELAAVQSISLPKNCSSSISSPSTSSFRINEYDSDDILSEGMSDENSYNLEFNNNVIDCDRSKISTPSNDKLLKLLLFLKEQNTQILKELKILNSKPNTQRHQSFEPPLDIPVGLPLRTVEDVLSLELVDTMHAAAVITSFVLAATALRITIFDSCGSYCFQKED
ncbi:hypothetical protein FQA39_LY14163 [Lamprigera yunnana]|nr:hypothetical protein FQA39_LY14163 [Lamprigera yunnana]